MYNPKQWVFCKDMTVENLCEYLLDNIPLDAKLNIAGDNYVYMHLEKDNFVLSLDDCSLSDLKEYENHEPKELFFKKRM